MLQQPSLERERGQTFASISESVDTFNILKSTFTWFDQITVRNKFLRASAKSCPLYRGAKIACEGNPADYIYVVVSGVLRR